MNKQSNSSHERLNGIQITTKNKRTISACFEQHGKQINKYFMGVYTKKINNKMAKLATSERYFNCKKLKELNTFQFKIR